MHMNTLHSEYFGNKSEFVSSNPRNARNARKAREELQAVQRQFAQELNLAKKVQSRMFYFEGLVKTAAMLTHEASGLLEVTKTFENRLDDAKRELEQDFTDEEIEDNLWDEDFANDFAERLYESLERVSN